MDLKESKLSENADDDLDAAEFTVGWLLDGTLRLLTCSCCHLYYLSPVRRQCANASRQA